MADRFKHVVLVGLSGSGKSTVGRLLAARLGRPFVDTDDLIVAEAGRPIAEIFAQQGEATFRDHERNRALLWEGNAVVWLDAPVEVLAERLGAAGAGRPLLAQGPGAGGPAARLAALRAVREAIYATAHARVDTTCLTPRQAVDGIMRLLERHA
jgi:shikimate kinase